MVDLDGDGHLDLLSGSWPGELFYFRGGPDRTFEPPVKLKNAYGKSINVGGGLQESGGDMILVAGDAKYERTEKGQVIVYEGERIEVPPGKRGGITGTASAVFAADWDGDGDMDLIVGNIRGGVWLVPNEGTRGEPAFGTERELLADAKPINVGHDAGPVAADWDQDGEMDLIVGSGDGSVGFYRNVGAGKGAELAAGVQIVPKSKTGWQNPVPHGSAPEGPGVRTKVCVADWNDDGLLDLLIGDLWYEKPADPNLTPEQSAERDELRRRRDELSKEYGGLARKPDRDPTDDERLRKLAREREEIYRRLSELDPYPKARGSVWLLLRKKPAAADGD